MERGIFCYIADFGKIAFSELFFRDFFAFSGDFFVKCLRKRCFLSMIAMFFDCKTEAFAR